VISINDRRRRAIARRVTTLSALAAILATPASAQRVGGVKSLDGTWRGPSGVIWRNIQVPRVAPAQTSTYDVVIYGGTAGGVVAAVSAARMGLTVALIEPTHHIGGMVTGGLSATDHGEKIVTGGDALAFYRRVGAKYGVPLFWYPEPKVAEVVLHEMLAEQKNVQLFMHHRLRERGGVRKNGANITELVMENGARFRGKIFLEASYEGDVM
jgi:NADPH-dependent 2,4-dienoyl-CoA reductase/sulfur reductase-like enzyme